MDTQDVPAGAHTAISAAAMTWMTVLIAFIGIVGYNVTSLRSSWHWIDVVNAMVSFAAIIMLAIVPWEATRPIDSRGPLVGLEKARRHYLLGVIFALSSMVMFIMRDIIARHIF